MITIVHPEIGLMEVEGNSLKEKMDDLIRGLNEEYEEGDITDSEIEDYENIEIKTDIASVYFDREKDKFYWRELR